MKNDLSKKFKLSKYLIYRKIKDKGFIYNALNGYLYSFPLSTYDFFLKKKKTTFSLTEFLTLKLLNEQELNELIKNFIILPCEINEDDIAKFFFDRIRTNRRSLNFVICPTLECNLGCIYCFEKEGRKFSRMDKETGMSVAEWVVKQAELSKETEIISLVWYGGEPLLNFKTIQYITDIIIKKTSKKITAAILTNGTLLTPQIIKEFSNLHIKRIQTCLDGNQTSHNKTRPFKNGRGSFNIIYENLVNSVRNFPNLSFGLRINVYKENVEGIYDLLDQLEKDGLNKRENFDIGLKGVFESPFNKCFTQSCIKGYELSKEIYKLCVYAIQKNFKLSILPLYNICNFMTLAGFVIDPEGNIYKCEELVGVEEFKIGNVKEDIDILELLKYFYENPWDRPYNFKSCKKCKLLPYCNGYCLLPKITNSKQRCWEYKYTLSKRIDLLIKKTYYGKI